MYSTQLLFRLTKIIAVTSIALMALLIVIGNTTDYYSNYYFVEHVMKMDTIFPDSSLHYRSIRQPFIFHAGYCMIIFLEAAMAFCCMKASLSMCKNSKQTAAAFHASKKMAVAGLAIGILIWFAGFEVIGGEWFAMWQSSTWNGLGSADRILTFLTLTLILLHQKEEELPSV
jgi:predicted small integral membrane protein